MDPAILRRRLGRDDAEGIWPENLKAVTAYLQVQSQWRIIGQADGTRFAVGLDYAGVKAGLKLAGVKVTKKLMADLQFIELGARAAMNGVDQ